MLDIKINITILILCFAVGGIHSQNNIVCYEHLTLKEFLGSKIENDTNFVKQIYINVKYPPIARKHEYEGKIEILFMSHKNKDYEVIILNQPILFESIEKQIHIALQNLEIDQSSPFLTRFNIIFSLDNLKYSTEYYEKFRLGLINDDTFNIIAYRIPLMDRN